MPAIGISKNKNKIIIIIIIITTWACLATNHGTKITIKDDNI